MTWTAGRVGDRDMRLERRVHLLRRAEDVLEDVVGLGEGLVDVAAPQMVVERDIGIALAGEVLEVGEHAGRLQLVVHIGGRGHRLDLVVDRRKLLVID